MGFLSSGKTTTQVTKYSGLQVQSTSSALPVPIVYGRNLLAPNAIWYQNFQSHAQKTGGKGGGKGGSSKTTSYTYTCDIILGICEGPVAQIGRVWQTSTTPTNLATLGLSFFNGAQPQSVWSYLASKYPTQALSYGGTCLVAAANYNLGSSAAVNSDNFEVYGVLQATGCNGIDADPARIVYDFLTNSQYGAGFPAASIDATALLGGSGTSSFQAYCWASGVALSPVLNSTETAASILDRWLQLTNSTAVWSGGLLKIIPYAATNVTGNGQTYVANTTPVYSLTSEDFIYDSGSDPVTVTRIDPYEPPNWQSVEICSRADSYITGPVTVFDQSMIERFGLKVGSSVSAHEICDVAMAQTVAQLIMQRKLYVRRTFAFKLPPVFCLLDPMDLVQITESNLGSAPVTVRITDVEEDDNGILAIAAEEFLATSGAVAYPVQAKSSGVPDTSVAPASINTPLIIEPPTSLSGNTVELWIGVSPQSGDPNWGGCFVYASLDNSSFSQVATIGASAEQGVTTSTIPAFSGSNPDTLDTLGVDLTSSAGALTSTNAAAAAQGVTLCYVGGEFLSFTNATLTAANKYNLTNLYRGQGGVASVSLPSGSVFCLIDSAVLKYTVPAAQVGNTVYLKFISFNIFGLALQSLTSATVYSYTISGSGVIGPVASALSVGTSMDFGHIANDSVSQNDDYGTANSAVTLVVDLGNCTS